MAMKTTNNDIQTLDDETSNAPPTVNAATSSGLATDIDLPPDPEALEAVLTNVNKELDDYVERLIRKELELSLKLAEHISKDSTAEQFESEVKRIVDEGNAYVEQAKARINPGNSNAPPSTMVSTTKATDVPSVVSLPSDEQIPTVNNTTTSTSS